MEKTNSHCPKCGAELDWTDIEAMPEEEGIKKEIVQAEEEASEELYHFKTLLGFGKFISGLGWAAVILGLFGVLIVLATLRQTGIIAVIGGIYVILSGILIVTLGQVISCFVAIERNTRLTYKSLKLKEKK